MRRIRILTPGYVLYLTTLAGAALLLFRILAPRMRPLTVEDMARSDYRDSSERIMRKIDRDGLIHDLRPHAKATHDGIDYATNDDGLRDDHDYALEKPPGVRRVIMLGDSFVFGYGLNLEHTLTKQLASLLDPAGWEVLNLGVPAYNTVMEVSFLEARGLKYDADDVLLMYHPNDALVGGGTPLGDAVATEETLLDYFEGKGSADERRRVADYLRSQGYPPEPEWNVAGLQRRDRGYLMHHFMPLYWSKTQAALDRLGGLAHDHHFRVHVAIIPELGRRWEHHPFDALYDHVLREMERHGFVVVDLYGVLRRYPNDDLRLWGHDGHTSAFANRIIAHVLAEHLNARSSTDGAGGATAPSRDL
jgi:hypothetical protein